MKHYFTSLLLALIIIAPQYSCKKVDMVSNYKQEFPKPEVEKIKKWVEVQPSLSNSQRLRVDNKIIDIPNFINWDKAQFFVDSKTYIVPVSINNQNTPYNDYKYLVLELDENNNVKKANYYDILLDKGTVTSPENSFINPDLIKFKEIPSTFTGAIIQYDIAQNKILTKHFEQGILMTVKDDKVSVKKSKNSIIVGNTAPLDPGCSYVTIDWYWQTYVNGSLVSEVYLFSTNSIYCGGEGGNGGGGTPCGEQNEIFAAQGTATNGAITSVDVFVSETSWIKSYNWAIYTAGTWGLLSYEKGTMEKIHYSNNDRWEFQSFEHLHITEVGVVVGGTRTYTDMGATINISSTKMRVDEQIDFTGNSKVSCFTNPLTIPYNATKVFHAPNTVVYE